MIEKQTSLSKDAASGSFSVCVFFFRQQTLRNVINEKKTINDIWVTLFMPVNPSLRRLRQENHCKLVTSIGYVMRFRSLNIKCVLVRVPVAVKKKIMTTATLIEENI